MKKYSVRITDCAGKTTEEAARSLLYAKRCADLLLRDKSPQHCLIQIIENCDGLETVFEEFKKQ